MPSLDMRTIFACYLLVTFICAAVVAQQWRQYRRRYRGLGSWAVGFGFQLPGLALISLRGAVPELVSATLGNALIILGLAILLMGLRVFLGARGRSAIDFAAFALFVAAHAWFTTARPDLNARIVLFSLAMLFVCVRGIRVLERLERGIRPIARGATLVLALFCLSSLGRIAICLVPAPRTDFLADRSLDAIAMIAYLTLYVALTFSMVSMIGRRVFYDQERLIAEKSRAEAALAASEEKFSKAFQSSPDSITITRLSDGRFIEVNDGFCRISGYAREEALGEPPIDVWGDIERARDLAAELRRHSFIMERDVLFRVKSGRTIHASYSGGLIELDGETYVVSVVRDLYEKDRAGMVMLARLELREYAVGHTTEEVMVKALDEIEAITDSRIGFYHFVDEDQGAVSLQAWSTRTSREFCKAEGDGAHYPIASAGVWADGLRERRPIIHNDYASLPNRKGMPEGHAAVKRELVVPTFRDGRVVSILGVGNKPTDYVADDVALVSYVADLVWTIVEQKKADERILELNEKLAELALTDELTGIANRRAFFAIAERELAKSSRYSAPLSFLMMDIDHFKLVNDTRGHDAGDAVLRSVAGVLKGQVRDVDVLARLGGEEFGVLMPSTRLADAVVLAERLRAAVAASACEFKGVGHRVTISIGVAARVEGAESLDEVMKAADEALYRAKAAGRNRVEEA
jgi:diguanylate cyclase (GGDEF)-like protein/PAS domain S-box-containing protein